MAPVRKLLIAPPGQTQRMDTRVTLNPATVNQVICIKPLFHPILGHGNIFQAPVFPCALPKSVGWNYASETLIRTQAPGVLVKILIMMQQVWVGPEVLHF